MKLGSLRYKFWKAERFSVQKGVKELFGPVAVQAATSFVRELEKNKTDIAELISVTFIK